MQACRYYKGTGVTGEVASADIQRLHSASPHILSAAVFNWEPLIVTAYPDSSQVVGSSLSFNPETLRVISEGERHMSLVFLSAEEIPGSVVIMHPVFGSEDKIIGGVSTLITPATAIPEVTASHFTDTNLSLIVDQVDTTILYDSDPKQSGLSIDESDLFRIPHPAYHGREEEGEPDRNRNVRIRQSGIWRDCEERDRLDNSCSSPYRMEGLGLLVDPVNLFFQGFSSNTRFIFYPTDTDNHPCDLY
ncbi:hypothetical protein KTGMC3_P1035 [Methanocalculus sp. MC3]